MEVASHAHAPAELAAALINALVPGSCRGQTYDEPRGDALRAAVANAVAGRPNRARIWAAADDAEHVSLAALAGSWSAVFDAAQAESETVARLVNALLSAAPVHPVLVNHDGEAWHLHAHADNTAPANGVAAICALGLANIAAAGQLDRLGRCHANACDRVYVDTSRNGSRRYCCGACQARAKSAAFRARRS
jgi:predicted RNA-binding Zn ribbon-like protein